MKTKIYLLLLLISLGTSFFHAQGENDNWYFGKKAALNFSNITTPIALNNSQMESYEACGTASDASGNLLFYCNSQTIWNRQHQPMLNGTGLLGHPSAQQLAIVKNPANANQYYVFIATSNNGNINAYNKIVYSIVDMSLGPLANGTPLGDVLPNFKNIPVTDNIGNTFESEAITIVGGTNAYWILIPNGNNLYSYKLDNTGFSNGNPIISNLNFPVTLGATQLFSIKASPKLNSQNFSNYLCVSHWQDNAGVSSPQSINRVVSFDSNSGSITNDYSLNVNAIRSYQPEFNSNGSVLFLAHTSIFAIDLQNSTTSNVNSMQIFNGPPENWQSPFGFTTLQRNKHGNIYVNKITNGFLGIINNPNVYSSNMSVTMNSLNLGNGIAQYGLPQLIPQLEPFVYYPCIDDLTLTSEPNLNFNYEIGTKITTKDKYILGSRHNITMQAGESVNLLPGTDIQYGAQYYAFIAPCRKEEAKSGLTQNKNQRGMVLELDTEERKTLERQIDIYPNPTSSFINIDSGNEKITSWELFDISGRSILKGSSNQINVQGLPKTTYLLNININNKITTKKVIVK